MARVDLGGGEPKDDLAEALRQLERQQTKAPESAAPAPDDVGAAKRRAQRERETEHRRSRQEIQGAVEAIRERAEAVERAAPSKAKRRPVLSIVLAIVVVAALAAGVVVFRPEPLPSPATSPEAAVRGFWEQVAAGRFQGATVYYPGLVEKYGSRKQAALHLEQTFREDPPTKVGAIGEPEELPDTSDLRVSYEVWRRSGRPRTGEFIVRKGDGDGSGYIIITGP